MLEDRYHLVLIGGPYYSDKNEYRYHLIDTIDKAQMLDIGQANAFICAASIKSWDISIGKDPYVLMRYANVFLENWHIGGSWKDCQEITHDIAIYDWREYNLCDIDITCNGVVRDMRHKQLRHFQSGWYSWNDQFIPGYIRLTKQQTPNNNKIIIVPA